ncbi:MAG: FtsQ-type POTRA domain-containing protein [Ruminococcaceae bacterium]|nr:FtsQ-type POTRA domain-containing protein [Oscillospiraceae bacterium]
MNRESENAQSFAREGEGNPSSPPHVQRKKANRTQMRLVGLGIMLIGCIIILLCFLLLILPLFRVQSVEVVGNRHYSAEEIIELAGVEEGTEVLAVDVADAADALLDGAPYIQSCRISVFPFSVKIEIEEKQHVMYTEHDQKYVSFEYLENEDTLFVLEVSEDVGRMDDFPNATLPQISSAKEGGRVAFTRQNLDLTYMKKVIDALEWYEIYEYVESIDFSSRANVFYELEGGCRVKLGTLEDLEDKIAESLNQIANNQNVVEVDVSDLTRPTVKTY